MIRISQIDDNLSIFKKNSVIVWGKDENVEKMVNLLLYHEITIKGICDFDESNVGESINGIPILSVAAVTALVDGEIPVLMQESPWFPDWDKVMNSFPTKNVSFLMIRETWHMLFFFQRKKRYLEQPKLVLGDELLEQTKRNMRKEQLREALELNFDRPTIIICTPFKTGDHSLMQNLEKANVPYLQFWGDCNAVDLEIIRGFSSKVKLFFGVRDPISQNISLIIQFISRSSVDHHKLMTRLFNENSDFFQFGGNVQDYFDFWLDVEGYLKQDPDFSDCHVNVQSVAKQYQRLICDFTKYPFDRDKGFGIVEEGNLEIFIYQIEKLSFLNEEISSFLDKEISITHENNGDSKWIGPAYKQSLTDLKFSRAYFEKCYEEPFLRHCYSEDDIATFKNRWIDQVIDDS